MFSGASREAGEGATARRVAPRARSPAALLRRRRAALCARGGLLARADPPVPLRRRRPARLCPPGPAPGAGSSPGGGGLGPRALALRSSPRRDRFPPGAPRSSRGGHRARTRRLLLLITEFSSIFKNSVFMILSVLKIHYEFEEKYIDATPKHIVSEMYLLE